MRTIILVLIVSVLNVGVAAAQSSCQITVNTCPGYPQFQGTHNDFYAPAASNQSVCLDRVLAYYETCGSNSVVTANYIVNQVVSASRTYPSVTGSYCQIQADSCSAYPQFQGINKDFYAPASNDVNICMNRAKDYYESCGQSSPVTATFIQQGSSVRSQTYPKQELWSLGFYYAGNIQPFADMQWEALTHVAHAAAAIRADGSVGLDDLVPGMSTQSMPLIQMAHSKGKKVILCLGIYDFGTVTSYSNLKHILNTQGVAYAAAKIAETVYQYNYDGVDVDWEGAFHWDSATDFPLVTDLLRELRRKLGPQKVITFENLGPATDWTGSEALTYLDRLNVMTYNLMYGPTSWFNSALYSKDNGYRSLESMMNAYINAGVPKHKLNMGMAFYGVFFHDANLTGPYQAWPQVIPKTTEVNYSRIINEFQGYSINPNYHWDELAQVPWLEVPGQGYITFDNEISIAKKAKFIRDHNLGGWIIWEIGADYLPSHPIKHPLQNALVPYLQ